ncbi:FixH family protein [Glaciimonas sp. PCH181]|uniref:FixH family protein n=1 Tax=Glaciimonas sp. PCH181 TaxID=2133943 RepID=UPI000D37D861|nr:FixH family protein [Glaciimonas sp. PCH181]PUA19456.1 cytochrome oxidase assembly protein [Glaciimonas sp. PCH181]
MLSSSPSIAQVSTKRPWYKQAWPWLLMLGPGIVVMAATYTGWLAFSRQDAMVVDDYYKQGLAINQDLRRDSIATGLGLKLDARYDPSAGKLSGSVLGFGGPVPGKILIHLAHPTQPEKDIKLVAQLDPNGSFTIALPMLERAQWQVLVESDRRDWRLTGLWKWPQQMLGLHADLSPADR